MEQNSNPQFPQQPAQPAFPPSGTPYGQAAAPTPQQIASAESNARIVYILHLVSLLVGVTAIVGVIMAYVNQDSAPEALRTHYRYAIRTFWIGILYSVLAIVLMAVVVGFLLAPLVAVWFIVRCVKGLKLLGERQPIPNPATWLW
jgi:uncharacterized membrane protein